jgi:hypothetical protein
VWEVLEGVRGAGVREPGVREAGVREAGVRDVRVREGCMIYLSCVCLCIL